WKGISRN
ncbi:mutS domain II family protein, partial [Vibrio parahaemolyticus V-223/04]